MNNQTQPVTKREWCAIPDEQRQALLENPAIRSQHETVQAAEAELARAWVSFGLTVGGLLCEAEPVGAPISCRDGSPTMKQVHFSEVAAGQRFALADGTALDHEAVMPYRDNAGCSLCGHRERNARGPAGLIHLCHFSLVYVAETPGALAEVNHAQSND